MNPSTPQKQGEHGTGDGDEEETSVHWSLLDESELIHRYWREIAPAIESDGHDPSSWRPSHDWLRNHGFRPLLYTLREHHDMTFSAFWSDVLGLSPSETGGYDWQIVHEQTIELLEQYLDGLDSRGELAENTINTLRYRLARYARAYAEANETSDLISPIRRDAAVPEYEAVDACIAAFDVLHEDIEKNTTKLRVYRAVKNWYAHLVRRKRAAFNPVAGLDEEYKWQQDESGETPSLEPRHVAALFEAAETVEDELLVIALAAWGLRSSEVAGLHRSQVVIPDDDGEVPHISFEERKNGPGEVSVLYGLSVYQTRVAELISETGEWNGYVFPSSGSSAGHITRDTVLNRFDRLAEVAGLPSEIKGEKPVPKMARRFWYDAYSSVLDEVLSGLDEIAAEQGSEDAEVVAENYLSPGRMRELRRKQMRERLSEAFDGFSIAQQPR